MSKSQRDKGANGERELCAILSEQLGVVVKRKLGQARDAGHDIDLPPYRIECKRRKRIAGLYDWMHQATWDATSTIPAVDMAVPVVALRADGKDWLVCMKLSDWIPLIREEISK